MLLLNWNPVFRPDIMTGARPCNGFTLELYITFDFQAKTLLLTYFIVLNAG